MMLEYIQKMNKDHITDSWIIEYIQKMNKDHITDNWIMNVIRKTKLKYFYSSNISVKLQKKWRSKVS